MCLQESILPKVDMHTCYEYMPVKFIFPILIRTSSHRDGNYNDMWTASFGLRISWDQSDKSF